MGRTAGEASPLDAQTRASSSGAVESGGRVVDGRLLGQLLGGAVELLSRRARQINNLNVFPVPDGDTGTNLLSTLRVAVREATVSPATSVAEVAATAARGALMGARGNSGVIFSQYLRGFAQALEGKAVADGVAWAG